MNSSLPTKSSSNAPRFTAKDIAVMAMMLAIVEAAKRLLDSVPNVEMVTLLFVVFALTYGLRTLIVAVAFIAVEICYWGVHVWVIMYLYIWPAEILFVYFTRRYASYWFHAVFSALFGFCFGALCSIPYLAVGGWSMAFTWWVAGIPYDILHGVSNFVLCLILYRPLMAATKRPLSFCATPGRDSPIAGEAAVQLCIRVSLHSSGSGLARNGQEHILREMREYLIVF